MAENNTQEVLAAVEKITDLEQRIDYYLRSLYGTIDKPFVISNPTDLFLYWAAKKKILQIRYNINWLHPRENSLSVVEAIVNIHDLDKQIEEYILATERNGEWLINERPLGSCWTFWAVQKKILKEKYGIEWFNPAEENPLIQYE